jgi:hypothetical protein
MRWGDITVDPCCPGECFRVARYPAPLSAEDRYCYADISVLICGSNPSSAGSASSLCGNKHVSNLLAPLSRGGLSAFSMHLHDFEGQHQTSLIFCNPMFLVFGKLVVGRFHLCEEEL